MGPGRHVDDEAHQGHSGHPGHHLPTASPCPEVAGVRATGPVRLSEAAGSSVERSIETCVRRAACPPARRLSSPRDAGARPRRRPAVQAGRLPASPRSGMPSRRRAVDPGHHGLRRGRAGAAGRPGGRAAAAGPRGGRRADGTGGPGQVPGHGDCSEAAEAMARGASALGWSPRQLPLADGGEGLLDALGSLGGERRTVEVEGPLGRPVAAEWLLVGNLAVVEMAEASGLVLAGGAAGNDPLGATTRGTGQLMVAAARAAGAAGGPDRADGAPPRWSWDWAARPPPTAGGAPWPPSRRRGPRGRGPGRGLRRRCRVRGGRRPVRPPEGRRPGPGGRAHRPARGRGPSLSAALRGRRAGGAGDRGRRWVGRSHRRARRPPPVGLRRGHRAAGLQAGPWPPARPW